MMQPIWAPWRMEYILSKKGPGCIFCEKPKEQKDRENLILLRGAESFVIMNLYPYNNGHLMVVPNRHVFSITELRDGELLELMKMTQKAVTCLREAFMPEGFNIGLNIGKVAGAGIEEHLHFHIIPRWVGDTHFMAALSEVRVIPEHVLSTYDRLFPIFNREGASR
ncbi:MAG TPA: HIT domain-containing protein [Thermodesulfovibrionales bacterium]|nr:HIT domain-containing protein [Thermodesulfovibrionales bacterium]